MLGASIRELNQPVFVTGHTGFKGSWLSLLLRNLNINQFGFSLDPKINSLYESAKLKSFVKCAVGDIRDYTLLSSTLNSISPSVVIHLAAQPLVIESYNDPLTTFQTNVIGTANLLQSVIEIRAVKVVLVITTDKVYKNENSGLRFKESDSLYGKDPYSASKVAAENVCAAYRKISELTGGPKILVARAGNVIGGGDYAENRLIPDIITSIQKKTELKIRNPHATRPWQHVLDPLIGYLKYIEYALVEETFPPALNFGPIENSMSVSRVIEAAEEFHQQTLVTYPESKEVSVEAQLLELDSTLSQRTLDWQPHWTQEQALTSTFSWWKNVMSGESSALHECQKDIEEILNARST